MEPITSTPETIAIVGDTATLYVPTDIWESVVTFYTYGLNQQPNPNEPPRAVFQLPDGVFLEIIATNDNIKLATMPKAIYVNGAEPAFIEQVYQLYTGRGYEPSIPFQTIKILLGIGQKPVELTLAGVFIGSRMAALPKMSFGLTHNPDWS